MIHFDTDGKTSIEDDFMYGNSVASSHVNIRLGFLRKVYGILSAQFLCTIIVGVLFLSIEPLTNFAQTNQWIFLLGAFLSLGLIVALIAYGHKYPTNYYLLFAFTLCESFTVGNIVTFYKVSSVLEAFFLTCGVTLALTAYTFQSKRDFSSWGASLFAALWVLIIISFMQLCFPADLYGRGLAAGGAILFSLFLIFDTHMIMKKFSPEDYILATITLYLDIINIFVHILRVMGERRN